MPCVFHYSVTYYSRVPNRRSGPLITFSTLFTLCNTNLYFWPINPRFSTPSIRNSGVHYSIFPLFALGGGQYLWEDGAGQFWMGQDFFGHLLHGAKTFRGKDMNGAKLFSGTD